MVPRISNFEPESLRKKRGKDQIIAHNGWLLVSLSAYGKYKTDDTILELATTAYVIIHFDKFKRMNTNPVDQDQWQQDDQHKQPHIGGSFSVVVCNGFNVGGNEHYVHAARTQLIDEQKDVDYVSETL